MSYIEKLSFNPQLGNSGIKGSLFKSLASVMVFYITIIVFIIVLGLKYIVPIFDNMIANEYLAKSLEAVIIIAAMSPFMRAIIVKKNKTIKKLLTERDMNKGILVGLIILRIFICVVLTVFVLSSIFKTGYVIMTLIALAIIAFIMLSKTLKRQSIAMEKHFISNLNEKEELKENARTIKTDVEQDLLSRNMHLAEFEVSPESPNIGLALKDIHMREKYGVNIVSIKRGTKQINIPSGDEQLFPYDKIIVVGTDKQLDDFDNTISRHKYMTEQQETVDVTLEQMQISETSALIGKTIKNSYLRDKYNCMIVGIERDGETLVNPGVNVSFMSGDILSLVGEKEKIETLALDYK